MSAPQNEGDYKPMNSIDRRQLLAALAALGVLRMPGVAEAANEGLHFGPPQPYSFEALAVRQKTLATRPFVPVKVRDTEILNAIDYDAFWKIKYRPEATLEVSDGKAPVRFFHLGRYAQEPVGINVISGKTSRKLRYEENLFEVPDGNPAKKLPDDIGFAGFRVMNEHDEADWLAFLGAAYFRSSGEDGQYGMSARAVAIDVAMPTPEEFPRFTDFYIGPSRTGEHDLTIACLMDGPRITGILEMDVGKDGPVVMDIRARFFAREDIERVGLAPLTSMFWFSETDRERRVDWRPEIHDSDGLAIWTGSGERIWRPLNDPPRVMTSSFSGTTPKGFGLLQRDRNFDHYQDDGVFYDKRPSVWAEPKGDWGKGAVQLVEIPTDEETSDNIVAYWVGEGPFKKGQEIAIAYRLTWAKDQPNPPSVGITTATRLGRGGIVGKDRPKDTMKFAIDFDGGTLAALPRDTEGVEAVVSASRGKVSLVNAYSVKVDTAWRATFDITADGGDPVELRCYLKQGNEVLTETWLYQYFPKADGST